jgi:hypothetical protein
VIFDSHGSGCNVCIDITLDARPCGNEGLRLEIRQYIDETYPATMQTGGPPPPSGVGGHHSERLPNSPPAGRSPS